MKKKLCSIAALLLAMLIGIVGCAPAGGTSPADSLGNMPTWMWAIIIGFVVYLVVFKRKKKD